MNVPRTFSDDLARVGVTAADPWDLVNTAKPYADAIPALIDWLDRVDLEIAPRERARFREGLVRALTVKEARGQAGDALVNEFKRGETERGYRWVVANAIEAVADQSVLNDLIELAKDRRYGADRQMLVLALARVPDERSIDVLVELLNDDEVAGHAAKALGRLKPKNVRPAVERLLDHPKTWVRTEAKKTLAKLQG